MTCKSGAKRGGARQRGFLRRFGFVYKTNLKDPVGSSVRDRQVPRGPLQVGCRSVRWCAQSEWDSRKRHGVTRPRCWKGAGNLVGTGVLKLRGGAPRPRPRRPRRARARGRGGVGRRGRDAAVRADVGRRDAQARVRRLHRRQNRRVAVLHRLRRRDVEVRFDRGRRRRGALEDPRENARGEGPASAHALTQSSLALMAVLPASEAQ